MITPFLALALGFAFPGAKLGIATDGPIAALILAGLGFGFGSVLFLFGTVESDER